VKQTELGRRVPLRKREARERPVKPSKKGAHPILDCPSRKGFGGGGEKKWIENVGSDKRFYRGGSMMIGGEGLTCEGESFSKSCGEKGRGEKQRKRV